MKNAYFTKDYISFFIELARNNNKEWFDANKGRYQSDVKKPFENFVQAMIDKLSKAYGFGDLKASDCIFRINKDIRFSKDKTPYKIQMSALITKGGRKNMTAPGLYIEAGPEFLNIYTGVYMPEKQQLYDIRKKIVSDSKGFEKLITKADFKKYFGEPKGERSKILPPEFKQAASGCEWIFNKQFYLIHTADAETILKPDLLDYIAKVYSAAKDYNEFIDV